MLRPVCSLPAQVAFAARGLSTPRSGRKVSLHAWGLLPGAPMLTGVGLAPTEKAQRAMNPSTAEASRPFIASRRTNGLKAYKTAQRSGYEGLVAKDLSSRHVGKRSRFWLKVKVHQEDEFVIVGYTLPEGSRKYFGALLLGAYERGKLHYVGNVGAKIAHGAS